MAANPHVVLPDELLAAGPAHGGAVGPRRRDEARGPALPRALAVVAYDDAAAQIRHVDGVRAVVVAGHVVLVLGRAHLRLPRAEPAAGEHADVEQVGDQLLLQPPVAAVRRGRGHRRGGPAPGVERPGPHHRPHERGRREHEDPDPHRRRGEVPLPPPRGGGARTANAVLAGLLGVVAVLVGAAVLAAAP